MLISVPFSPRYMAKAAEYYWPQGNHSAQFTMTDVAAEAVLDTPGAKLDLMRTSFQVGQDEPFGMEALKEASHKANDSNQFPSNLTDKEVRRIYAVALSNGEFHLQGGLLQFSTQLLSPWFCYFGQIGLRWDVPTTARANKNLMLTHSLRATELMERKGEPLVVSKYRTEIVDKGDAFSAHQLDKYEFAVDVNLWREEILPKAHQRLSDSKPFDMLDIFALVPCLRSRDFAKTFAKRLAEEGTGNILICKELIAVCFADKPKYKNKIINAIDDALRAKDNHARLQKIAQSDVIIKAAQSKKRNELASDIALGVLAITAFAVLFATGVGAIFHLVAAMVLVTVVCAKLYSKWNEALNEESGKSSTSKMMNTFGSIKDCGKRITCEVSNKQEKKVEEKTEVKKSQVHAPKHLVQATDTASLSRKMQ